MIEGDLRDEVLDALGRLTRVDPEPFVSRPIALPTREHFPEPWAPTRAAQETLAQRLLSYVGLGEYVADVTIADGAIDPTALLPVTKVDFAGVEGKTIYFSVHTLGRTEDAAFAFAHEVARAALFLRRGGDASATYRDDARDRLAAPSDEDDDFDASVLAAHLGLGVLVAAGAFEFRTLGYMDGRRTFQTAVARVEHGGLPPEAASFLVAVQLCVRAIQGAERAAILKTLPTERADEVREVLPSLDREALLRRLGLPPPSEWRASALPAPTAVRLRERPKKKEKEPEGAHRVPPPPLAGSALRPPRRRSRQRLDVLPRATPARLALARAARRRIGGSGPLRQRTSTRRLHGLRQDHHADGCALPLLRSPPPRRRGEPLRGPRRRRGPTAGRTEDGPDHKTPLGGAEVREPVTVRRREPRRGDGRRGLARLGFRVRIGRDAPPHRRPRAAPRLRGHGRRRRA